MILGWLRLSFSFFSSFFDIPGCPVALVHPDLHLHWDVQHVSALRALRVSTLGQSSGGVHGHSQLFTDPHLGRRGHQQGIGNTKRSLYLLISGCFCLCEAELLMQTVPLLLFSFCSVLKNQSAPWTPGGSTMPTAVRGWAHKWSRRGSTLRSPSRSQTWISMRWRGRWGARPEAESSSLASDSQRQTGWRVLHPSEAGGQTVPCRAVSSSDFIYIVDIWVGFLFF